MTTAVTGKNRTNLNKKEYDDLTVINDIGPVRQKWLRESFGVRTYEDLSDLSANEIESRLRAEGQIASRSKIEEWIAQAQELSTAIEPSRTQAPESPDADAYEEAIPLVEPGAWGPLAAFVIEFQAREVKGKEEEQRIEVTHIPVSEDGTWLENDRHKAVVKGEQIYHWMLAHLGKEVEWASEAQEKSSAEVRPFAPPIAQTPTRVPRVSVQITQIRAFQPPRTEIPVITSEAHQPCLGFLRSGEPFMIEALLELTGPAASEIAKEQVAYYAQFHARDLASGAFTFLGNTESDILNGSRLSYITGLPEATLPSGTYRLEILAMLESKPPVLGYLKVPLLQVV